jgi:hypothetical protein
LGRRLELRGGDSSLSVPAFVAMHGDGVQCDLVFIDGDHTFRGVWTDLQQLRPLANRTAHSLVLDDVHMDGAREAFERGVREGLIHGSKGELFYESDVVMEHGGEPSTKLVSGELLEIAVGSYVGG